MFQDVVQTPVFVPAIIFVLLSDRKETGFFSRCDILGLWTVGFNGHTPAEEVRVWMCVWYIRCFRSGVLPFAWIRV